MNALSWIAVSNAPSRLTVITLGRSLKRTIPQFQSRLLDLLSRIGIQAQYIQMQRLASEDYLIYKTVSRSMLSSMNEIAYVIQHNASSINSIENLNVSELQDYLSAYLFGSKEIGKNYFTPAEYLKGHQFLNLN